jgi:hypothetical protein
MLDPENFCRLLFFKNPGLQKSSKGAVRTLLIKEEDTALLKAEHAIPLKEAEQRYFKSAIRELSNC